MAICECTGNKDLEPFLPSVVKAAQSIDYMDACAEKLAGCIFAQNVEAPALAATLPVLTRGLNDKSEEVERTCCPIVDNMCEALEDPAAVLPIMPRLEPLVKLTVKEDVEPGGQWHSQAGGRDKPNKLWNTWGECKFAITEDAYPTESPHTPGTYAYLANHFPC